MPLSPSTPATHMLAADCFAGTTVLIVAGDHELSEVIAGDFAHYGAAIGVVGEDAERCRAISRSLPEAGSANGTATISLSDPDSVGVAFDAIEAALGPVSVLINPYATAHETPAEQMTPDTWRSMTNRLLDGSFFCAQELARRRIDDGTGGVVINFATPYVATGGAGLTHVETARAGLAHLTKSLAVEWAAYNIRVNAVAPGYLGAPHGASTHEQRQAESVGLTIPAGRVCEPFEVSACVLYMCSPYASYLTGHIFDVDGASWQRPGRLPPKFEPVRVRHAN